VNGGGGLPEPPSPVDRARGSAVDASAVPGGWPPHDIPSAAQLLDAVRQFLESEVLAVTEGRVQFHVRVAANVLSMVAREIALGPEQAAAHARRLEELGVHSDAELAGAIRAGALDSRWDEVRAVVEDTVTDKLAVANPRYLRRQGEAAGDHPGTGP
jgi:hypothetical protein